MLIVLELFNLLLEFFFVLYLTSLDVVQLKKLPSIMVVFDNFPTWHFDSCILLNP